MPQQPQQQPDTQVNGMALPQLPPTKVVRYSQTSFMGGEYSPICAARTDLDRYKIGLETCRNSIIHPTGGVSNRPGFRMIAPTKTQDLPSRMVKFIFSVSQVFWIEFGNYYCRFYTNRSQIQATGVAAWVTSTGYVIGNFVTHGGSTYYCIVNHTSGTFATDLASGDWVLQTAYEIPTAYAQADINDLRFEESADFIYITHQNYPQMILERLGDADWSLVNYLDEVIDGPFLDENDDVTWTLTTNVTALNGTGIMAASKPTFNAQHLGALWRKTDYIQGQNVIGNFTSTGVSGSISCFTSWLLVSQGTWEANFQLEMSEDGGITWTVLQYFTGDSNFNVDTSNTESVTDHLVPFLLRINCTSYTSGTLTTTLSSLAFYQDGFVRVTDYIDSEHVGITVLQELGLTGPTPTWAEGAWSPYRGYPGRSRFYQDRLGFYGSPNDPDTEWFTADGDYESFIVSTPGEDSDGISVDLNSRQLNAINGVVAFQALLVLTSNASWATQPISGAALTPSTIDISIQDYNGSDGPEPVVIGNEAIFAQFQGHVIRSIVYQFAYASFTSAEINIFARHLLEDWSVLDMCYQQNPDNIIWFLRSDGQLLGLTYLKEQEVVAWHHHDTNGTFESMAAAPGIGYTEMWVTTSRPNGRFVEVLENRITNDVRQSFFVDNGISNTPVVLSVTNIQILNGIYLTDDSGNLEHDDSGNLYLVSGAKGIQVTIPSHGLSTGAIVEFDSVVGMTQINGQQYDISVLDSNNFILNDAASNIPIDGTTFNPYISGGNCVQCFLTFDLPSTYNGQTVSILGDGFVFPQQVVSGGVIVLTRPCAYISVGMQFISDVETLPVELSFWFNPPPPMTTQGRQVKIGGVTFTFVDSRGGWVGTALYDNYGKLKLQEAFFPIVTSVNGVLQLYSGDKRVSPKGGWEVAGRVFYRQYDPLPFTIVRIIPEVIVGGVTSLGGESKNESASGVGTIEPN